MVEDLDLVDKVTRVCPVCTKEYIASVKRLRHGRQTTCSRECSYAARGVNKRKGVVLICPVCDSEFLRSPSQAKPKHGTMYCSPTCQYKGRGVGLTKRLVYAPYTLTESGRAAQQANAARTQTTRVHNGTYACSEATKEKLRNKTTQRIVDGRWPRVSKIEKLVSDYLVTKHLVFIPQWGIRDPITGRYLACVDFYLPEYNVAVEVNGTFWHADPRFYDHVLSYPSQRRTLEKYKNKIKLLHSLKIPLIEVWEYDLKKELDFTLKALTASLSEYPQKSAKGN